MPITVYERPGRTFTEDEKGYVSGSRKWKIVVDTLNASPIDIYTAVGVNKYDQHPYYTQAIARTPKLTQDETDVVVWNLEIEYSSAPFEASGQPDAGSQQAPSKNSDQWKEPELRPPVWAFTRKEIMRVLEVDAVTGSYVTNSARFPYDPPIEVPSSNMLIRIDFWTTSIQIATLRTKWDRVNSAAWKGFPIRTLRINDFNAKTHYEKADGGGLLSYWECSVEIEHSEIPWNPRKILDQGSVKIVNDSGVMRYERCKDGTGNPIVVPLNGSGEELPAGDDLVFREVNAYKEEAFATILFP
ncbi:hypothetical protein [Limnoglobus roseus]|uniref:Uncharacterized protein n=1 Tax=Limnoglobus roseus TaxID=2598579 RepID=A0A5C1AK29_9BACT|nr:hypothetical protein [Limnoglobus roseus]QEL18527.1 hypothetical protein PX52LOC_05554 [Limnoglobus roseus]